MLRNILPSILFLCVVGTLNAQTIYLKVDNNCMNRLEYGSGDTENPYVSYAIKLGDRRFANFDVGVESEKWVNDLPGKVTQCSALKFDKEFVQKVNSGKVKLHIVRESATQYHVAQVDKAGLLETVGGTMDFQGEDTEFSLNLSNPVSGINLALPGSKTEIYLDGTINYQCLKGYILQKKESHNSRSFKEYVIVPDLGIVERASVAKSGFVDDLLRDNEYKLAKVDNLQFKSILSDICDRAQASYYDSVSSTDKLTAKSGTTAIPTGYSNTSPCSPSSDPNVHVVQKGETLYALSRKYGIPVTQLQNWNKLTDGNVINLCQRLWVRLPANDMPPTTSTPTTTEVTEKTASTDNTASAGYWTSTTGEHQVRTGETVTSIAKMYGYTEERFRKMNGLSPTETLRLGQRLRTNDCNCPVLESSTKDNPQPYDQATETITTTPKAIDNKDVYYRPITVHLVETDDTWFSIAKQYNTTVERILELNGLTKNDKLVTDQRIYVQ